MHLVFVLDCNDADDLASFWAAALGYQRGPYDPPYVSMKDPKGVGPKLLLQQVPEPKNGKNRMHMDLVITQMDREVARLRALGATVLEEAHQDTGSLTTIMADPAGNEFRVVVA